MSYVDITISAGSTGAAVEVQHSVPWSAGITLIPFIQLVTWNSTYDKPQLVIRSIDSSKLDIHASVKNAPTSSSSLRCFWAVFAI